MLARVIAVAVAGAFVFAPPVLADEIEVEEEIMIEPERMVQPVSAAPAPRVELSTRAIAAGIGLRWGRGSLWFRGEEHAFSVMGVSVGDVGFSSMSAIGEVRNLNAVSDLAGRYVALEVGAAAGVGASALTMRNEKGVVITLRSEVRGVRLTLAGEGLAIALR